MEKTKPTMVFMTSRFPFPLEKGDKLRAFNLIKGFSSRFNVELISLSDEHIENTWVEELKPFTTHIHIFRLKFINRYLRLMLCWLTNQPFQVAYFTSFLYQNRIRKILNEINPDHIFCQMIRPAEYVKNYHRCTKTLDFMDALSIGMERRAEKAPWFSRWVFRMEAMRLKEYEQRIFNYFEFQIMISKQDVNYIVHPDQKKMIVVPNGIDTDYFSPQNMELKPFDLVFVGNLSYAPNIDAMLWFSKNVLEHHPEWQMLIAGANPSQQLVHLGKQHTNITLLGWQPDIRKAYASGKIFVAPMQIGTGMQNKLLEAMSMEIPCITTPLASDALESSHRDSLMIAKNSKEIEACILELLNDPEMAQQMAKRGRNFVKTKFSWQQSLTQLESLFTHPR